MSFIQFLTENASVYSKFVQDYTSQFGDEELPSQNKFIGLMNRRGYKSGQDKSIDFTTNWLLKNGFMKQVGGMVAPTPKGSSLRQSLSIKTDGPSDLKTAADGGYKDLRRYFQNVSDEAVKPLLAKLDDGQRSALEIAQGITQEDIAILNGLSSRVDAHKERQSLVNSMMDKNPERLERLIGFGFINQKDYTFNKQKWSEFTNKIESIDPALVQALIPKFAEWARHLSGNTAKTENSILFKIHPESRNRSVKGEQVWDLLTHLDNNSLKLLQAGKKPKQGELSDKQYELLLTAVAAVVRMYPEVDSSEELITQLDNAFKSRVDFKSIDRSIEKVRGRRSQMQGMFSN